MANREIKPFQLHLGHQPIIDMDGLYNHASIDEEWIKYSDNSGEYKDVHYYSFNAHRVLELITENFAKMIEIREVGHEVEYHFRLRREY